MNIMPLVSVVIPTYKRPIYLKRAINSVVNQTYINLQIIVVDDNNEGDIYRKETEELMFQFTDTRIIYLKHKQNRNGSAARNTGIKVAKGKYIAFLDDDDEFLVDKIEKQVIKMESLNISWGGCYTSYKKINKNKKIQNGYENREGYLLTEALMRTLYIQAGSNLFVRKSVIDEIGGFDEHFTRNQDLEFLVRLLTKFKLAYVDSCSLIVHYEIRDSKRSYNDLKRIDNMYLENFEKLMNELSVRDKKRVHTMIALDNFRRAIIFGEIKDGIKLLKFYRVRLFVIMRYIIYLFIRVITRRSYGFKL